MTTDLHSNLAWIEISQNNQPNCCDIKIIKISFFEYSIRDIGKELSFFGSNNEDDSTVPNILSADDLR